VILLLLLALADLPKTDQAALAEAVEWMKTPPRVTTEWNYVMTGRVRLLLFWTGRDDVGGGYIRRGVAHDDAQREFIQILFGSDPQKAPRAINRWGAGAEIVHHTAHSSAFFGFMKSSKGASVAAMEQELSSEKQTGKFFFDATINRADSQHALARTMPFQSDTDFDFRQYAAAEREVIARFETTTRPIRRFVPSGNKFCARSAGFLATIDELLRMALQERATPITLCYVYNARYYTATLQKVIPTPERTVRVTPKDASQKFEKTYRELLETRFLVVNHETGNKNNFTILLGTAGELRGVPVQISYQPNWWFQVVLNLKP
jgi:hypothetical protein